MSKESMQQMCLETIDPKRAAAELGAKHKNFRRLDENYAKKLAEDIKAGNWQLNGETVKYNGDGSLKDGQHRLRAIILSDTPIKTWVFRGLSGDTCIDTGKRRNVAQMLRSEGYTDTNVLGSALTWLWQYDSGCLGIKRNPSMSQSLAMAKKHPGLTDSIKRAGRQDVVARATLAMVHYVGNKQSPEKMEEFIEAVAFGTNLGSDSPARLLRERMLKDRGSKTKLSRIEIMALTIKTWRYFRDDRAMEQLKWTSGGERPEAFPDIDEEA